MTTTNLLSMLGGLALFLYGMQKTYLAGQIERAKTGKCKTESGILFSELLTDFERIGDYAQNLAELHMQMR